MDDNTEEQEASINKPEWESYFHLHAQYRMGPILNNEEFRRHMERERLRIEEKYFVHTVRKLDGRRQASLKVLATLLYTHEDVELATYVQKNYNSLDEMSGDYCTVFVIEKPPSLSLAQTFTYWRDMLSFKFHQTWSGTTLQHTKPYDKAVAYQIARELKIYPDQLPCIVFFESFEDDEKIVIPIQDDLPTFFRTLFGSIEQQLTYNEKDAKYILSDIKTKITHLSKRIKNTSEAVVFEFNGQTVFINKPFGEVHLKNFQNSADKQKGVNDE